MTPGPAGTSVPLDVAVPTDDRGRAWGPDLFAWVWDRVPDTAVAVAPRISPHDPMLLRLTDELRAGDGWWPADTVGDVQRAARRPSALPRTLALLDAAHEDLLPWDVRRGHSGAPSALRDRFWAIYASSNRLNRSADGLVLPKGGRGAPGLARSLANLTRIGPANAGRLNPAPDLRVSRRLPPRIRIAVVPTLWSADDVRFVPVTIAGRDSYFATELEPVRQAELRSAMDDCIRRLEAAGVHIAVFPEAALDEGVAATVTLALQENRRRLNGRNTLRFVVLGTAGGPPTDKHRNSVMVLTGNGDVCGTQRKQFPWELDGEQLRRYGIATLGTGPRLEAMEPGETLSLIDVRDAGRIVLTICEDLRRYSLEPPVNSIAATGPLITLAPVMNGSLEANWWAASAADRLAVATGAMVVISNSGALDDAQRSRGDADGLPSDKPVLGRIAVDPPLEPGLSELRPDDGQDFLVREVDLPSWGPST